VVAAFPVIFPLLNWGHAAWTALALGMVLPSIKALKDDSE
jgi:hypothetical protein